METFEIPITYDNMEAFVKVEAETRAEAERAALAKFREGARVGPQTRPANSYTVIVNYDPVDGSPVPLHQLKIEAGSEEDAVLVALEDLRENLSGYDDPCEMNETNSRCDSHGYDNITEGYNGRDLCTVGAGLDLFDGLTNSQIKDRWAAAKEGRNG